MVEELREAVRPHGAIHTANVNEVWARLNVRLQRRGRHISVQPEFRELAASTMAALAPIRSSLSRRRSEITAATVREMKKLWYVTTTQLLVKLEEITTTFVSSPRPQHQAQKKDSQMPHEGEAGTKTNKGKPSAAEEVSSSRAFQFFNLFLRRTCDTCII